MRMRMSVGEVQALRGLDVRIDRVDSQEYLENVIAYVLRNPLAAGVFLMPYHYPWSSAALYFNGGINLAGERVNDMSERKRFRILKSRISVPDHYLVDANGMVLPSCYVDVEAVERIFRHPSRLMALMSRKVENDVEVALGIAGSVSMTDQEMLTQMNELVRREFHKDSVVQLTMEQRIRLCLLLKRNFMAGAKQIARLTRLDPEIVAKVI